ncbi:TPA: restriction endonuclease subunit S [Vibrio parahaemolyticus]
MSWPLVKLADIANVVTGATPKKRSEYYDGDVPFVTPGDLGETSGITSTSRTLTKEGADSVRSIPVGSVMVCCIGATIGKVGIAEKTVVTNQQINSLVVDERKAFPKYVYYYCATLKEKLKAASSSTTMPIVNKSNFSQFEIPLPPLDEQKRIAAILDKADVIRQKRKQAIGLADEFLRSVFLDMFGDPVTNPKGWEQVALSTLSEKILNGTTPKGGSEVYVEKGIAFLRSQNVWKKRIDLDDIVYLDDETHAKMSKSSLKNKDILITKTGRINTENSSLGRAAIYYGKDDQANINGHVYLVRLKPDNLHEFIEFILTTKEYRDHIRSVCVGGIDKRQLNKNHIEDFPIIWPPISEQQRFVKILHQSQKVLDNYKKQLVEAQNNFSALTQKAFSGQL